MVIRELAGRAMNDTDILGVLKKSCSRWGANVLAAYFEREYMRLTVLIDSDDIVVRGNIGADMDGVLTGYIDKDSFEVATVTALEIEDAWCPVTKVTGNTELYNSQIKWGGGTILCEMRG